jgi:predicted nuclease of predicted toxin-antitoxin system
MKLLANENFPSASVLLLRARGFDIKAIGADDPGVTDEQVLKVAIQEQRTILTFDKDYGELIFRRGYRPADGVIFLRWKEFGPEEPGEYLADLLTSKEVDFGCALTVIDEVTIRQRRYIPRTDG